MPPPLLVYSKVDIIDLVDLKDLMNNLFEDIIYACNIIGLYILGWMLVVLFGRDLTWLKQ